MEQNRFPRYVLLIPTDFPRTAHCAPCILILPTEVSPHKQKKSNKMLSIQEVYEKKLMKEERDSSPEGKCTVTTQHPVHHSLSFPSIHFVFHLQYKLNSTIRPYSTPLEYQVKQPKRKRDGDRWRGKKANTFIHVYLHLVRFWSSAHLLVHIQSKTDMPLHLILIIVIILNHLQSQPPQVFYIFIFYSSTLPSFRDHERKTAKRP